MSYYPIEAVFQEALQRYRAGEKKYGPYDPGTDARDMIREAEGELLDAINYIAMFLMKLRAMKVDTGAAAIGQPGATS